MSNSETERKQLNLDAVRWATTATGGHRGIYWRRINVETRLQKSLRTGGGA